ncbi:MAG TPA: CPBP family intramembrane glutamic endopeptidase [Terriglobia bacterium]|nr:CPBP family intramembrane glutamic endopeptidase [Terriglobia bacterium]
MLKKLILAIIGLLLLAVLATWVVLLQVRIDPERLVAFFVCLSLVLGLFVALTNTGFVKQLRTWAVESLAAAMAMPLLLLVPYFVVALGTRTFSVLGLAKLVAYIVVPVALLLPDRFHRAERVGWRDFAAMLSLALPVAAGWLSGIWMWPEDLYAFRPVYSVLVGGYAFMVIRNLEGVGYRLILRRDDLTDGLANLVGFSVLGIPLGIALNFIHFHSDGASIQAFVGQFLGIYLTIAIPEELLFRGILQNFLVKTIQGPRHALYGLVIASVVFGLSHLHHAPVPNWRYAILATLAGLFYGNAYRTRHRLCASALTHALVDTMWHFWF